MKNGLTEDRAMVGMRQGELSLTPPEAASRHASSKAFRFARSRGDDGSRGAPTALGGSCSHRTSLAQRELFP